MPLDPACRILQIVFVDGYGLQGIGAYLHKGRYLHYLFLYSLSFGFHVKR